MASVRPVHVFALDGGAAETGSASEQEVIRLSEAALLCRLSVP